MEKLWRKCADLLYEHPSLVPVRFCLPNYPREWISMESQLQPFRDFINDSFLDQPQFNKPVSIFFHGGYVLVLMEENFSANFVRDLLPEMRRAIGIEARQPTREEIGIFHVTWADRSPGMFGRYRKQFHNGSHRWDD